MSDSDATPQQGAKRVRSTDSYSSSSEEEDVHGVSNQSAHRHRQGIYNSVFNYTPSSLLLPSSIKAKKRKENQRLN